MRISTFNVLSPFLLLLGGYGKSQTDISEYKLMGGSGSRGRVWDVPQHPPS